MKDMDRDELQIYLMKHKTYLTAGKDWKLILCNETQPLKSIYTYKPHPWTFIVIIVTWGLKTLPTKYNTVIFT